MVGLRAFSLGLGLAIGLNLGSVPAIAHADATTVRVTQRYAINATLDLAAGTLEAVETLTLTNRAYRSIDHLNLSVIPRALGYLAMDEAVTVNGEAVPTQWTTTTNLRVSLPERLAPNATAEIRIPFRLAVGASGGAFSARLSRDNGVLSFGEWFPILSRPHDSYGLGDPQVSYNAELIRLDLTTTSPLGRHAVACPGLEVAPITSGTYWVCEVENVRDFSFVVNPSFGVTTRTAGSTTLRVYTQTVSGAVTADKAQAALIGLNQAFGAYPWPDLVLAEVGAYGGFSMEFPRAIHLTRSKVTDTYVIDHEVAHQWFYAQLGNHQMLEPWLDEGFADFSARYLMGIGPSHCSSRDVDSAVFAWDAGLTAGGDWDSCDGYFHTVFYKGTAFLNAVRSAMGDGDFFAALRAYLDSHRYGITTTRGLLDHLEAWNGADLLPIYQAYLLAYDAPRPGDGVGHARDRQAILDAVGR
ncbi:MAG: M1 family aminopeptidase [Candidatus Limnocylindria bacterium]